jgi:hypothetical protein
MAANQVNFLWQWRSCSGQRDEGFDACLLIYLQTVLLHSALQCRFFSSLILYLFRIFQALEHCYHHYKNAALIGAQQRGCYSM